MNFDGKHCPKCGKIPRKKGRKYICRCGWSYTEPGEDYDDTVTQNLNVLTSSYSSSLLQDLYNNYTMDTSKWIWVTGYKGTDATMKCRDMTYSLGDRYDLPESISPVLCTSGFHFCLKLKDVFGYYDIENGNRFFEVKALVRESDYIRAERSIDTDALRTIIIGGGRGNGKSWLNDVHDTKIAAKSIIFTRELTTNELLSFYPYTSDWTDEIKDLARHIGVKRAHYKFESELLIDAGFEADVAKLIYNSNASQQALKAVATYGAALSKMMNAVFGRSHENSDNE